MIICRGLFSSAWNFFKGSFNSTLFLEIFEVVLSKIPPGFLFCLCWIPTGIFLGIQYFHCIRNFYEKSSKDISTKFIETFLNNFRRYLCLHFLKTCLNYDIYRNSSTNIFSFYLEISLDISQAFFRGIETLTLEVSTSIL